jgi:pimeloyl-ACP methyl ester carboxylesterase
MRRALLAPDEVLPPIEAVVVPPPGEVVALDAGSVYVRRTPGAEGAEPALYVHGLGGSSLNWTDLAHLLSGRLDGEAIDLPGFGNSRPARTYTVAAMSELVIRWIEVSGRGPVHLFGNSLGGAISVRVAGLRPDLIRTLTLISPAMPFIDPRRSLQSRVLPLLLVPQGHRLINKRLAGVSPEEMARLVVAACYAEPDKVPEHRWAEVIEEARRRNQEPWYLDAYLRSLRGLVGTFLRSYLGGADSLWRMAAKITAPTLVLTGRQDKLVDIRTAPAVAQAIPDSRLLVLDRVGHVAQMEVPRIVARAALGLLDDPRGAETPVSRGRPGSGRRLVPGARLVASAAALRAGYRVKPGSDAAGVAG